MVSRKIVESLGIAAALLVGGACSGSVGPEANGGVTVRFKLDDGIASGAAGTSLAAPLLSLDVSGTNGVLTLDAIHLVVDEFKLGRVEGACEAPNGEGDACENFEAPPFFVEVPLDGDDVGVVSQAVPADTYVALKFETKAPKDDGSLLVEIRVEFDDWPEDASALVMGTFTPLMDDPISFRVFFDAEVKVELEFDPPFEVTEGDDQAVTVFVDPAIWFANPDDSVVDLSAFDFDETGEVVKLEVKFEDGFTKVEVD